MTAIGRRLLEGRRWVVAAALTGLFVSEPAAQSRVATSAEPHVKALASERMNGRLAGGDGERFASDYLIEQLSRIGARPLPGQTEFRLPFEFTAGSRDGGSEISVSVSPTSASEPTRAAEQRFRERADIEAFAFSDNGAIPATPAVFAGYGIVVPEGQAFGYDSYAGIDVKDKVVVVLRYFPEDADQKTRAALARYADLRYKALAARQRGARAMLVVTGPRSPNAGQTIPMAFDTALSGSGIVAASISARVGTAILAGAGRSLEEAQKALDEGNPHVAGFDIPGAQIAVRTAVVREPRTAYNVVGYLPATEPLAPKPWVALGAHYDHLGRGDHGNSLASDAGKGQIHAGADDNASGSAAVLAIGEWLAGRARRRHVLLGFWSGEEIGLIGSTRFTAAPPVPLTDLAAYLNFDMVGRMQDNVLVVQAAGSSPAWARLIEQANVAAGFSVVLQQDPFQPTDVATFNQAGVPSLNFFTGTHGDYHRPSDTADRINYEDLDRIVGLGGSIALRIATTDAPPEYSRVEPSTSGSGRAGLRVFTGTVPDYATEAKGLRLSGVVPGGPAEQAGLRAGDVIVEIAGQTIANIYDYTYALDVLKIGEPAKVVYVRDGRRAETLLTPAARR